jgi:hypothetical protein
MASDDQLRKLLIEWRRGTLILLQAVDKYLADTSRRPERAQRIYGPDAEEGGYIAELEPRSRRRQK